MKKKKLADGNIYCLLCKRSIGNAPDSFNAVWDLDDKSEIPLALAVCCDCVDTYNKILSRRFRPVREDEIQC